MNHPPLIVGIAGGTGSGKTTVAHHVAHALGEAALCIDHDAYYRSLGHLSAEERARVNFDHPDALESELLIEHLQSLRAWQPVKKPVYDFKSHTRTQETVFLEPRPVVVVEGILTLAVRELRETMDLRVFVDTAADIRLMRRIRRDIEQRGRAFEDIRTQYYRTVRPMHRAFVEPSKEHADVIIPEGGENQIAIDVLLGHLRDFLSSNHLGSGHRARPKLSAV